MNYQFTLIDSETGRDLQHWVFVPPVTVGRGMLAHIRLDDGSISRKHCQFVLASDGSLTVRDLGSKNGIYIDGKLVDRATVEPGSIVQVGLVKLRVEVADESTARSELPTHAKHHDVDETHAVKIFPPEDDRYEIE